MVVANALCALTEIRENASYEVVQFTSALLFKLLRALNECTEWGQVRAERLLAALDEGDILYQT